MATFFKLTKQNEQFFITVLKSNFPLNSTCFIFHLKIIMVFNFDMQIIIIIKWKTNLALNLDGQEYTSKASLKKY